MVLLVFGLARDKLLETLQAGASRVRKWGGRILIAVGPWLIALNLWADSFAPDIPGLISGAGRGIRKCRRFA